MDAQEFLAQRLDVYAEAYYTPLMSRLESLHLTKDSPEAPDPPTFTAELDPAVIRGDIDAALRSVAADFVTSFNEMLGVAAAREPLAGRFVAKYTMQPDYQLAMEQQLRSALTPVWAALGDMAPARNAYLAYQQQKTGALVRGGLTAASAGMMAGSVLGPVGMLIGAGVGWALGDSMDKQEEHLLDAWHARYTALLTAVDEGWQQLSNLISSRFSTTFGEALQRLSRDVESERARLDAENRQKQLSQQRMTQSEPAEISDRSSSGSTPPPSGNTGGNSLVTYALGAGLAAALGFLLWQRANPDSGVTDGTISAAIAARTNAKGPESPSLALQSGAVLRAGPSSTFAPAITESDATEATILDTSVPGWMKVRDASGGVGWIEISAR